MQLHLLPWAKHAGSRSQRQKGVDASSAPGRVRCGAVRQDAAELVPERGPEAGEAGEAPEAGEAEAEPWWANARLPGAQKKHAEKPPKCQVCSLWRSGPRAPRGAPKMVGAPSSLRCTPAMHMSPPCSISEDSTAAGRALQLACILFWRSDDCDCSASSVLSVAFREQCKSWSRGGAGASEASADEMRQRRLERFERRGAGTLQNLPVLGIFIGTVRLWGTHLWQATVSTRLTCQSA